jgi:predicted deacylase
MKDYAELVQRFEALQGEDICHRVLSEIEGYPILLVRRSRGEDLPTALIVGGTHGDEPAGVEAVMAFLMRDISAWLQYVNFEILVCLNAYGYVHNTRDNGQDIDINRAWSRDDVPEIQLVKKLVNERRFIFALDFHEDWESPGYYLYELRRGAAPMAKSIVAEVEKVCPLNTDAEIEGMAAAGGIVYSDIAKVEKRRGDP